MFLLNNYRLDKKIRVGAVNWDASTPKESSFGYNQIESLSCAKYRTWAPFYADIIDDERIDYHLRTVEEYERELSYAIAAGIDYFAFVWYPVHSAHKKKSNKIHRSYFNVCME